MRKQHCILPVCILILVLSFNCSDKKSGNPSGNSSSSDLRITYPVNNATVSGVVTIVPDISASLVIDMMKYYIDGLLADSVSTSPFQYQWNTQVYTDHTTHTIQIKGYENGLLIATSNTITVTVINNSGGSTPSPPDTSGTNPSSDSTPPTVSVTSPANNAVLSGTTEITAYATDNDAVNYIEIYINGELRKTGAGYSWNTMYEKDQTHAIYAKAFDMAGNSALSSTISVQTTNSASLNQNFIENPGFESGANGWYVVDVLEEPDSAYAGNNCAIVDVKLETGQLTHIHFQKDQRYKISFYHKRSRGEVNIKYRVRNSGGYKSYDIPATSVWTLFEQEFTLYPEAGCFTTIEIRSGSWSGTWDVNLYIDNISLMRIN